MGMMEKMTILVVEPGKAPRLEEIEHAITELQRVVGGCIQAIYPWDEAIALVANDNGIAEGLEFNCFVRERRYGPIFGTFFLCGLGQEDFISISGEQAERYAGRFAHPELLLRIGRQLVAVPMD